MERKEFCRDCNCYYYIDGGCVCVDSDYVSPPPKVVMTGTITFNKPIPHDQGVKHDQGKPKLSMVPTELLVGAARAFEFGATKYGRDNYKLGMDWTKVLDALERHTRAFVDKKDLDEESKLCHLYHAAACVGMLLYYYENKVGKDDR